MSMIRTELKARDVMTEEPVCVSPATSMPALARILEEHEISGVPVLDQQGRVVGIVSKTDLIRRCLEGVGEVPPAYLFEMLREGDNDDDSGDFVSEPLVTVGEFMTEEPLMVPPDLSASAVAQLMCERHIHRVIVADHEGFPLGIITSLDLLSALARRTARSAQRQ